MNKHSILSNLIRFLQDRKGVAAVEFAMIAPMLLILYLGATDLTQGLAIDRKLGQFATAVSDQMAREQAITENSVQSVIGVGRAIMLPFAFGETKLRLTVVEVKNGAASVKCSTHYNWTQEAVGGDVYPLSSEMARMAEGQHVIIATAAYEFTPLLGYVIKGVLDLEQQSIFLARNQITSIACGSANSTRPPASPEDGGSDGDAASGDSGSNTGTPGSGGDNNDGSGQSGDPGGSSGNGSGSGGDGSSDGGSSGGGSSGGGGGTFICWLLPFLCH